MTFYPAKYRSTLMAASLLTLTGLASSFSGFTAAHAEPAGMMPPPPTAGIKLAFMTKGIAHAKPTNLTIEFIARKDNTSPTSAQLKLNQLVDDAVKAVSEQSDIKTVIGNYSISQEYTEKGAAKWSARQNIKISGTNSQKLLSYTEKLQKIGLNIDNFSWSLDPQTRHKLEQQARTEALQKVRMQAEADAHDLGLKFIKLEKIVVQTPDMLDHMTPHPMTMMFSRSADVTPPPQSTPEDQSVTVTVMVRAQLDNP